MDEEHHSTGMLVDGGIGVGSKIIQKVVHIGGSIGGGYRLFGRNFNEADEYGVVNGYAIIEENSNNLRRSSGRMGLSLAGVAYWTLAPNLGCPWGWGEFVGVV